MWIAKLTPEASPKPNYVSKFIGSVPFNMMLLQMEYEK